MNFPVSSNQWMNGLNKWVISIFCKELFQELSAFGLVSQLIKFITDKESFLLQFNNKGPVFAGCRFGHKLVNQGKGEKHGKKSDEKLNRLKGPDLESGMFCGDQSRCQ